MPRENVNRATLAADREGDLHLHHPAELNEDANDFADNERVDLVEETIKPCAVIGGRQNEVGAQSSERILKLADPQGADASTLEIDDRRAGNTCRDRDIFLAHPGAAPEDGVNSCQLCIAHGDRIERGPSLRLTRGLSWTRDLLHRCPRP
ncbi:MAG TPA: hypothetical protein VMZ33_05465 [Candidatus Limnocylindrales bacterium]|nr:hypothetical protein [Candidatus Limnocylindrales bacterium]